MLGRNRDLSRIPVTWWGSLVLAVLLAGCRDSPDAVSRQEESLHSTRDSSGVVVTTSDAAAAAPLAWVVDRTPDQRLGGLAARGAELFGAIRGVHGFTDGGIAVVDGDAGEVRHFNRAGEHVATTGRQGKGPAEFESPWLVPAPPGDTLLVFDGPNRRFTAISHGGEILAETAARDFRGSGSRPPAGAAGEWMLVQRQVLTIPAGTGLHTDPVTILWEHRESGEIRELRKFEVGSAWVSALPGDRAVREIPFAPQPTTSVHRDRAILSAGTAHQLEVYDREGTLREIYRLNLPRTVRTESDLGRYLEGAVAQFGGPPAEERIAGYREIPLPDSLPAFTSVLVDPLGCIFAQTHRVSSRDPARWIVFDPAGRVQGSLVTPAGLLVSQFGIDFLLGRTFEDFGIEVVTRYTLMRGSAATSPCGSPDSLDGRGGATP